MRRFPQFAVCQASLCVLFSLAVVVSVSTVRASGQVAVSGNMAISGNIAVGGCPPYGNCGYNEPPLSSPTHLTACNTNLTGTSYILDNDVGTDPTAQCLRIYYPSASASIDLGGHRVTGQASFATNHGGNLLEHGTVNCTRAAGTCISMGPSDTLRYVTSHNAASTGDNTTAIAADYSQGSKPTAPVMTIFHVTASVGPIPSVNRCYAIRVMGGNGTTTWSTSPEVSYSKIGCEDEASACQGVGLWYAPYSYIHHNEFDLPTTCTTCADKARGVIFDGDPGNTGSEYSDASYNLVYAHNNRAFRVRSSTNVTIHHNDIRDIQVTGSAPYPYGAIMVGDSSEATPPDMAFDAHDNLFQMGAGNGVVVIDANGASIYDNTATCVVSGCAGAGYFARTGALYSATGTELTVKNTTLPGGYPKVFGICGTGGTPACSKSGATTAVTYCNTGTYPSQFDLGTGATATEDCP